MKVLITNWSMAARGGTQLYVRDLAFALLKLGHTPIVYSTELGEVSQEIREVTIPVVDDLAMVSSPPDIIHGHHYHETLTALLRFPGVPAIYVCHDWYTWFDKPPRFPRILRYVAVDESCYDKLVYESAIPEERVRLMLNFVDLERFKPRAPLPERPKRLLILSNYPPEHAHLTALRQACDRAGLSLDVLGAGVGKTCDKPEEILGDYDIVLAKGRVALESLAIGTAVIPQFSMSLGPIVNADQLDHLLRHNLGARTMTCVTDPDAFAQAVMREIGDYDARDAALVSYRVRAMCGRDHAAAEYLSLYDEVVAEHKAASVPDLYEEGLEAARHMRDLFLRNKKEREILQAEVRQLASMVDAMKLQIGEAERATLEQAELLPRASAEEAEMLRITIERDTFHSQRNHLEETLSARETELQRITNSLGWRILSRYGRIKYRYLLPAYRMLGLSRLITVGSNSTTKPISLRDPK